MNIYQVVEQAIKQATQPLTCVDLFDRPEVRAVAVDVNAVSDALGNLWRRGYLSREPAPKVYGSQARYAYTYKAPRRRVLHPAELSAMRERAFDAMPRDPIIDAPVARKPSINISEEGDEIRIELPQIAITIKAKA